MGEFISANELVLYEKNYYSKELTVTENKGNYKLILEKRLFNFSVDVIKYVLTLPVKSEFSVFRNQLSKAGTAIGANYEEALGAFGKRDFISKLTICLKESRESNYWLRILGELKLGNEILRKKLEQESGEFIKIFTASIKTA
jgi:four helix bundle protein